MSCKFCGSDKTVKNGLARGKQHYRCKDCKHQYLDNGAFAGMRTKAEVIATSLNLYYDGLSTWKIQRQIAKIFKVDVSVTAIWKWIMKYSEFVDDYVSTLQPLLSGKYHHDETEIKVGGEDKYFWETLDKDTRFLVAHLLSESRTSDDAKEAFTQAMNKQRPTILFTDGSFSYNEAFNKVYYSRYKVDRVEWVRRVRFRARETNNIIERKHGTLKDRLRPTRGLKHDKTAEKRLNGYVVNYNFVKPHLALKGKTPAQPAGLNINADWGDLIKQATLSSVKREQESTPVVEVLSK
jgi:transposase-like protein